MARCLQFSNDFVGDGGQTYVVHFGDFIELDTCPINASHHIILDGVEYQNLVSQADLINTVDAGLGLIDPVEISAVFGTAFALIFSMAALAYKIKVGKRLVKLT